MGGPVRNYRRIPPILRISITQNDEDISGILYLAISSIKPRFWPAGPETYKRGGIKKYERTNIYPRERGKEEEKTWEFDEILDVYNQNEHYYCIQWKYHAFIWQPAKDLKD
jgi:hypothetical protein